MSEPLRTAIIACGSRAIQMAKIVSLLPEFKLVAMSDPHPAQRAEAFKALPDPKYYESTEEMLEKETLEEFRFLLNYRFDSMSPMALILVGQTELWDQKLRLQRYAAIRQRIDVNIVLRHLDRAETNKYIESHMRYAGGRQDIFTDRALDEVYKDSSGIPRMINRICEKTLMYASQQQKRLVDEHMVRFVSEHEMLKGGDLR